VNLKQTLHKRIIINVTLAALQYIRAHFFPLVQSDQFRFDLLTLSKCTKSYFIVFDPWSNC